MKNINAFLKLCAYERCISIKQLANETGLDTAYISRIFNNKIVLKKERNIKKLSQSLNIERDKLYNDKMNNNNLLDKLMDSICVIDDQVENKYTEIIDLEKKYKNTPFYVQILLAKFIYAVYTHQLNISIERIVDKLMYIEKSMEDRDKKIFLTFYLMYLLIRHSYKDIPLITRRINLIKYKSSSLEVLYYYYLVNYKASIKSSNYFESYEKCRDMCISMNNTRRISNLQMIHSNFLRRLGYVEKSLLIDLNTLKEMEKSNYTLNKPYLLNNIAWTYLLLNRYEESIEYYLRTIKSLEDNDIYFNLAWCYYCTKNKRKALEYIQKGMSSKSRYDYFYLLLEWLEKMINRKYSKRSLKLLLDVLSYHSDSVSKNMKEFVYDQIIDYYKYHKDFSLALYYSDELNDIVYEQETEKQ